MVDWYRIQETLEDSTADILLLLDCCFSGSAGRARSQPSRIEVLTASAKKEKTPMPGPNSFTNGLIKALTTAVDLHGHAVVSGIHHQLLHRSAGLFATTLDIVIRPGHPDRSIHLRPLRTNNTAPVAAIQRQGPFIRLLVQTPDLDFSRIEEIAGWLRTDIPNNVSLEVESIVRTTESLQALVASCGNEDQPLGRALEPASVEGIAVYWNRLSRLMDDYAAQHLESIPGQPLNLVEKEAREFLRLLDAHNQTLARRVEQGILQSTYAENSTDDLDSIIEVPQIDGSGIGDQLRLRRSITHSQQGRKSAKELRVAADSGGTASKWKEAKVYGQYLDPADLPLVEERVSFIANLLAAAKSSSFLSLKCIGWYHEKLKDQFVLEFDIPAEFVHSSGGFASVTLHKAFSDRRNRPTLGQRFGFASAIAKAVAQWHAVGWLHQTINSHNILFFQPENSSTDYSRPFLQGLDFARPKLSPSIGRYVDDPAFNVYRHADRQGPSRQGHTQLHDLYSLGVVLLEIGLWESACATAKVKEGRPLELIQMTQNLKAAATTRLAHYAGREYQEAVTACLESDFGVETDDKVQSQLALAFEAKVLDKLSMLEIVH